jgi:hypothetical protein
VLILLLLLYHSKGLSGNKQNIIFKYMVMSTILLTVVDLLTWFIDGKPGAAAYKHTRSVCFALFSAYSHCYIIYNVYIRFNTN